MLACAFKYCRTDFQAKHALHLKLFTPSLILIGHNYGCTHTIN